ncbi:hypothetical protein [Streptomyces sp. NPDC020742]|uniref:hypothetical protein n=1 Tax=Streptomyces sp. NPDC020742 TaxID=3154897 RepID=UPI00340BA601
MECARSKDRGAAGEAAPDPWAVQLSLHGLGVGRVAGGHQPGQPDHPRCACALSGLDLGRAREVPRPGPAEADRGRPGTAEQLAALPGITVLDLGLPTALAVAQQETWAAAHCQYAAQPTPDRPDGAIVATTEPKRWDGEPVRVLDLNA